MINIIWYEIATGKIISSLSTLEGTEEATRPAYDAANEIKTLNFAEITIDTSKIHLATYNSETNSVSYTDETNIISFETLVRKVRNNRLTECDWTQAVDSPLSEAKKAEWATYRQTLRDLLDNLGDATSIDEVTFPTRPS